MVFFVEVYGPFWWLRAFELDFSLSASSEVVATTCLAIMTLAVTTSFVVAIDLAMMLALRLVLVSD